MNALASRTWTLRAATLDDVAAAVEMFNACSRALHGTDEFSLEEYRKEWADPGISLAEDTRLATTEDGQIVGCIEAWIRPPYAKSWLWARVHPDWQGLGIGTTLMEWAEARAVAHIPLAPEGARVSTQAGPDHLDEAAGALLTDLGYQVVRHSLRMVRTLDEPLPAPQWPRGITLRTPDPTSRDEVAAIYRADQEAFRDHWGHMEEPFESGFARWMARIEADSAFDPTLWFVAMDGNEVAGISLCTVRTAETPPMGWVDTLAVRRPWRKQGLGLALLHHSFEEMRRRGLSHVGLGVDAGSLTGALRLYERAGMHVARQFDLYEKELRPGKELSTQTVEG